MENAFSPLNILAESTVPEYSLSAVTEKTEDYFATTLAFLSSINEEYDNANKIFYRSVLESNGDPVLIQEASGSFFEKFKQVIRKFLAFIQSLFQRFITKLNAAVKSEKYLLKHKKDFDRFTSNDNFDINGYVYTFESNVPIIDLTIAYDDQFIRIADMNGSSYEEILGNNIEANKDVISNLNKANTNKTIDKSKRFETAIKALHSDLKNDLDGSYYDRFRGKVLNKENVEISDDDFAEECWKVFRNGETSQEPIEIDRSYIIFALKRIEDYKDTIHKVEKLRTEIDRKYKKLEEKVDKMIKSNKVTDVNSKTRTITFDDYTNMGVDRSATISADAMSELNAYIKTLTSIVQEMSNIHSIAFSAKLEAIKGQYAQDKAALYTALSKCQSKQKILAAKGYSESADVADENIVDGGKLWII